MGMEFAKWREQIEVPAEEIARAFPKRGEKGEDSSAGYRKLRSIYHQLMKIHQLWRQNKDVRRDLWLFIQRALYFLRDSDKARNVLDRTIFEDIRKKLSEEKEINENVFNKWLDILEMAVVKVKVSLNENR